MQLTVIDEEYSYITPFLNVTLVHLTFSVSYRRKWSSECNRHIWINHAATIRAVSTYVIDSFKGFSYSQQKLEYCQYNSFKFCNAAAAALKLSIFDMADPFSVFSKQPSLTAEKSHCYFGNNASTRGQNKRSIRGTEEKVVCIFRYIGSHIIRVCLLFHFSFIRTFNTTKAITVSWNKHCTPLVRRVISYQNIGARVRTGWRNLT